MSDTSQNHDFPGGCRARIVTTSPIYDTCRAINKYLLNRRFASKPPMLLAAFSFLEARVTLCRADHLFPKIQVM